MNRVTIFHGCAEYGAGAERVLEYLLEGAVAQKHRICLLTPAASSVTKCARDLGYAWIEWKSTWDSFPRNLAAFLRIAAGRRHSPAGDVVHAWHTRGLEWAWALGKLWGIPASGTLHDDPQHALSSATRQRIVRATAARMEGIAAVSRALSQRCTDLGWNREISVIPNGLPDAPRAPSRLADGILRLGFLAPKTLWKGISLLPELIARTRDLPLQWKIFGPTTGETSLILDQLKTSDRVEYGGVVKPDEAFRRFDVLLHLSMELDPYPTVLLEAARAGIPVIATTTGGSPEIVVHEETGLLVPPGDPSAAEAAIRRLSADQELRIRMAGAARRRFENGLGVQRMVADYFAFWNRLRSAPQ